MRKQSIALIILMTVLIILSAGCSSSTPAGTSSPITKGKTTNLNIGDTATLTSREGSLEVTVRSYDPETSKITIEEKNIGTSAFQYNPTIRVVDWGGISYKDLYCIDKNFGSTVPCGNILLVTLYPQENVIRNFTVYKTFQLTEKARQGKITFFWSNYGKEASWVIKPA